MSTPSKVEIRTEDTFRHLPRAPIVEAVIDLRAQPAMPLDEQSCRSSLEPHLAGYRFLDSRRAYHAETKVEGGKPPSQKVEDLGWKGLRYVSVDQKQIAQFNCDGFVFSRLEPYVNWQQLEHEGFRLWEVFKALAKPVEVQRVGLRFINRIVLAADNLRFEDFLRPSPEPPAEFDLPFQHFMHHDTLAVPGHPYAVNVIRTIQPATAGSEKSASVILDIDVFTTQGFEMNPENLARRLAEMRWLKNKVFFGSVTEKTIQGFL
jgi:uncharacterized protein (TIGR04255 family)